MGILCVELALCSILYQKIVDIVLESLQKIFCVTNSIIYQFKFSMESKSLFRHIISSK